MHSKQVAYTYIYIYIFLAIHLSERKTCSPKSPHMHPYVTLVACIIYILSDVSQKCFNQQLVDEIRRTIQFDVYMSQFSFSFTCIYIPFPRSIASCCLVERLLRYLIYVCNFKLVARFCFEKCTRLRSTWLKCQNTNMELYFT